VLHRVARHHLRLLPGPQHRALRDGLRKDAVVPISASSVTMLQPPSLRVTATLPLSCAVFDFNNCSLLFLHPHPTPSPTPPLFFFFFFFFFCMPKRKLAISNYYTDYITSSVLEKVMEQV
jgi:hypothetical protein